MEMENGCSRVGPIEIVLLFILSKSIVKILKSTQDFMHKIYIPVSKIRIKYFRIVIDFTSGTISLFVLSVGSSPWLDQVLPCGHQILYLMEMQLYTPF